MEFFLGSGISMVLGILGIALQLFSKLIFKKTKSELSLEEKIETSIIKLRTASIEVDSSIKEIISDIQQRESALKEIVAKNEALAVQEEELKKKINTLKDIPIEVAKYFEEINQQNFQKMDKKSIKRDLIMFFLGIIVTTGIGIILKIAGIGG